MRIDHQARRVSLSVGELARFRQGSPSRSEGFTQWRAEVGQQWHRTAADKARAEFPGARFEESFCVSWLHRDWHFEIQGRIDQLLPTPGGYLIREVKSVREALPAAVGELAAAYPEYFAQAAAYLCLLRKHPDWKAANLRATLLFIDIHSGRVQQVLLDEDDEARFTAQLDRLLPYLDDRRNARARFSEGTIEPAFQVLRDGQAAAFSDLDAAATAAPIVLFEAPTGFGKTGTVLEHCLRRMQDGHYDRCIYLTSKSTGQVETVRQLQAMTGGRLRFLQMRNRNEHRIESPLHRCTGDRRCDDQLEAQWSTAELKIPTLFEDGCVPLEAAKSIGRQTGICPYAITRACLPYADFWIADYNYLFSPEVRPLFLDCPGFEPAKTCLIIDEAHNLPNRAADALSLSLKDYELTMATEALRDAGGPRTCIRLYLALAEQLGHCPSGQVLGGKDTYHLIDLCEEITHQLEHSPLPSQYLLPGILEVLWSVPRLLRAFHQAPEHWVFWMASPGELRATCLHAAEWIRECLSPFSQVYLMSATLEPLPSFRTACGLEAARSPFVRGEASWRDSAYEVAIDTRVDTRLKARAQSYETTAATIASAIDHSPGIPVAVFFSSYQYAENVCQYVGALRPELRIQIQPRGGDLSEREAFIEEGLLCSDALFLILGSSFAEGIDQLGGRVYLAVVVGPALPEMDLVQETRKRNVDAATPDEAFQKTCIEPAMCRIHQALGRLIRAPGQQAKILLHGKRFAEAAYFERLRPEFQTQTRICNGHALTDWLARP